jgi:hypothetical protein
VENCSAEKYFGSAWTGSTWSWIEKTGGFFENVVGPSVLVKCADMLCRLELCNYWNARTKTSVNFHF